MSEAKVAHLREFRSSNRCELMFKLTLDFGKHGKIDETVKAVRQTTDTVESLLQHIINKIHNSLKKQNADNENVEDAKPEIKVSLVHKLSNKHIKPKRVLKNIIQTNLKDLSFSICDQTYDVVINAPLIKELKLPVVLYSNFPVQPSRIHVLFVGKTNQNQFLWYKSTDKKNWIHVGNTFKYHIKDEDVGYYLKVICIPKHNNLEGPTEEAISENKVEKMGELPVCPFEERQKLTTEELTGNSLRVVSYNVLSSRYAETNEHFPYCSPKDLAIDYRKQLIGKELLGYKADIICLQEVDSTAYTTYYKDLFNEQGYSSYYHRKGNRIPEGLLCAFNKSRFKKISDNQVVFCDEIQKNNLFRNLWNIIKTNSDVKELFLRQLTSLQVTVLKEKGKENNLVIVANTHLFYHPEAEHIRVLQANMATTYINHLRRIHSLNGSNVSVIFCGDFNSTPRSSVYSYMLDGKINCVDEISKKISNKTDLHHQFVFESACGEPKYTNYTADFKDCLDYIFIEKNKMRVSRLIPFPEEKELEAFEGLPNTFYPSDHLALIVDLEFI